MKQILKKLLLPRDPEQLRNQWIIAQLQSIPAGKILLDAGCGNQPYRQYCQHLTYKTQDFGGYDGTGDGKALQRGTWDYGKLDYVGDIWKIDAPDASFDAILCTEVLEHIPYPNETLAEFARLLKSGGQLILTAPFCSLPHMTPYFFYSGFSDHYYRQQLTKFENLSIIPYGNGFMFVHQELWRLVTLSRGWKKILLGLVFVPTALVLKVLAGNSPKQVHELLPFGYLVRAAKGESLQLPLRSSPPR